MPKKVIIITSVFPPAIAVGGRRWAKLSSHLSANGYVVHIITAAADKYGEFSTTTENNIVIHRIKDNYPSSLLDYNKKSTLQKIRYRIAKAFLLLTHGGNIYDRSLNWERSLTAKLKVLIKKEKIKNIIVTMPPYKQGYFVAKIKDQYPEINLIIDFRDPWAEYEQFKQAKSLTPKRLNYEQAIERTVLKKANYIISVSEGMTEALRDFANENKSRFLTISNGVDMSDYAFLAEKGKDKVDDIFRILYFGSLYTGTENTILRLTEFINRNETELMKHKVRFEFCGHMNEETSAMLSKVSSDLIHFYGLLPNREALEVLNRASAALHIVAPGHENIQFNTKLYEYMALCKKIILVGPEGKLTSFIKKHSIGIQVTEEKLQTLLPWITHPDNFAALSYAKFDNTIYEYSNLVKKVEAILV